MEKTGFQNNSYDDDDPKIIAVTNIVHNMTLSMLMGRYYCFFFEPVDNQESLGLMSASSWIISTSDMNILQDNTFTLYFTFGPKMDHQIFLIGKLNAKFLKLIIASIAMIASTSLWIS